MKTSKCLIANRGEIGIRIAQAAWELNLPTVAVYSEDDHGSLHIQKTDEAVALKGVGPAAYLDGEQIIAVAKQLNCTLIHPGYGFLSENSDFAQRCRDEGLTFVGPKPETLALFGHKSRARSFAQSVGAPIVLGTEVANLDEAAAFFKQVGADNAIILKAVSGGGGRGMRLVEQLEELPKAWRQCEAEAKQAFGQSELYIEQYLPIVRHLEIQIIGDGTGAILALGERECSLQRRHQKIVEIAPAPGLSEGLRQRLMETAVSIATAAQFQNLGTFEFLVEGTQLDEDANFYFIEANPRLQVEHTITEEVFGVDLVQAQLEIASGRSLTELNLEQATATKPARTSMQLRINMETMTADGQIKPGIGQLTHFQMPSGSGIRTDSCGYVGFVPSPRFDSLLAKVICTVQTNDFEAVVRKAVRALAECHIGGVPTNITFLQTLLQLDDFTNPNGWHTRFIETHLAELTAPVEHLKLYAVAETAVSHPQPQRTETPEGTTAVAVPMPGSVVSIAVNSGDFVRRGQRLATIEAMKMEAIVESPHSGIVRQIRAEVGDILGSDAPLLFIEPDGSFEEEGREEQTANLDEIRPDLQELLDRRIFLLDENRPDAVAKRHGRNQRTARENVADLCDGDSFVEIGSATVAAQRSRRSLDDLIRRTPADGLLCGFGAVNGDLFDEETAQCMVLAYDYSVLAGTQGVLNHKKMDRMLKLAAKAKRPLILFAEGGGGRPGDVDYMGVAQLDVMTFTMFAGLSGKVPLISIVTGYCFAGNAALAGCSDVIIATENSSIGMGGPAMIEGGGLGQYHPREVGPASFQKSNGVIDILVQDEAEGVVAAKKYLAYFQGPLKEWSCVDQRLLRRLIPENRRRMYDIRQLIDTVADLDSVLELRVHFGQGIVTALIRVEGKPLGVIANNPARLGGAIDSDAADKAARFMQLCEAYRLPILSLVDTPGIMVGPEAERSGTVRHASRLFVTGASLSVPFFAIILRKGYGLGAQAMCAGSFHVPFFTLAWPTGEFGAMGLEGAVRLGFRKELEAAKD